MRAAPPFIPPRQDSSRRIPTSSPPPPPRAQPSRSCCFCLLLLCGGGCPAHIFPGTGSPQLLPLPPPRPWESAFAPFSYLGDLFEGKGSVAVAGSPEQIRVGSSRVRRREFSQDAPSPRDRPIRSHAPRSNEDGAGGEAKRCRQLPRRGNPERRGAGSEGSGWLLRGSHGNIMGANPGPSKRTPCALGASQRGPLDARQETGIEHSHSP